MVRCLKDKRLRVPEGSGDGCCFNAGMRITTMPESKQANRRDYPLALVLAVDTNGAKMALPGARGDCQPSIFIRSLWPLMVMACT
jgi:hypothetical protein